MFAGPNGSGKSTLIEEISKKFNIGYFINADRIESELNTKKHFDCSLLFPQPISPEEWRDFLLEKSSDKRITEKSFMGLQIRENFFTATHVIDSYQASVIAEFFREKLIHSDMTFSFETVMSHESKVMFLEKAKDLGFTTYLYFICTRDPKINIQRVKNRVLEGGHHVEENKITSRYFRSLDLLCKAFLVVDRAFIIDSSHKTNEVIMEKQQNDIIIHKDEVPGWIDEYLLRKLKLT